MSRIGIMGGTFNPIHTGHLLLAEHVLEMVGLDQVWLIPTGCSYLKRKEGITVLSAEDRYRMVNLAIADNDRFRCLDMEIRRPGNSYSYETMEQLQKEYPEDRFFFICGADCLYTIEYWKCADRLFAACTVLAAVGEMLILQICRKKSMRWKRNSVHRSDCFLSDASRSHLPKYVKEGARGYPYGILCRMR